MFKNFYEVLYLYYLSQLLTRNVLTYNKVNVLYQYSPLNDFTFEN